MYGNDLGNTVHEHLIIKKKREGEQKEHLSRYSSIVHIVLF